MDYKSKYYEAKAENDRLKLEICRLKISIAEERAELKEEIRLLSEKVDFLMKILEKKNNPKNSNNSSIPPSMDLSRKNKSTREKSNKKSGGQSGHNGKTLLQVKNPDQIVELKVNQCHCGHHFNDDEFRLNSKRQVIDIPSIQAFIKEFQQYSCICPDCNNKYLAEYPENVTAPVQYGENIQTIVSYLNVYQCIPFKRTAQLLSDVVNIRISQGSLKNILRKFADKSKVIYERIKKNLSSSKVVGSDETSVKVNGKKGWIWAWRDIKNVFLEYSHTRGYETIQKIWENGLPESVLVTDRFSAQLKTKALNHQICLAHILRDLTYIEEREKHPFSTDFKSLVKEIFQFKRIQTIDYDRSSPEMKHFEDKINILLAMTICKKEFKETSTLQKSLIKIRGYILPCVYETVIPPDNNDSERALRNVKVKLKVSGQFKNGAQDYCIIRSVIDTAKKRGLNIFDILSKIPELSPR